MTYRPNVFSGTLNRTQSINNNFRHLAPLCVINVMNIEITRHRDRASTSMYLITLRVRVMLP